MFSESSVKRQRTKLNLLGSRSKRSGLTDKDKEQIVLQQLEKDPAKGRGIGVTKTYIAYDQGVHLTRDFISKVMHVHDPTGLIECAPGSLKVRRDIKVPLGVHERWSGDGHDKLYKIGFLIWAIVDDGCGEWLGGWIVPSNQQGNTVGYLYLCLVEKYRGKKFAQV